MRAIPIPSLAVGRFSRSGSTRHSARSRKSLRPGIGSGRVCGWGPMLGEMCLMSLDDPGQGDELGEEGVRRFRATRLMLRTTCRPNASTPPPPVGPADRPTHQGHREARRSAWPDAVFRAAIFDRGCLPVQKIADVRPSGQPETTSGPDGHRAFDGRAGETMIVMIPDLHRG
jgi:hypothetical protein